MASNEFPFGSTAGFVLWLLSTLAVYVRVTFSLTQFCFICDLPSVRSRNMARGIEFTMTVAFLLL